MSERISRHFSTDEGGPAQHIMLHLRMTPWPPASIHVACGSPAHVATNVRVMSRTNLRLRSHL